MMIDRSYRYFNDLNGVVVSFAANGKVASIAKLSPDNRVMVTSGLRKASIQISVDGVSYDIDTAAHLGAIGVTPGL